MFSLRTRSRSAFLSKAICRLSGFRSRLFGLSVAARRRLPRGLKCRLTLAAVSIATVVMLAMHMLLSSTAGKVAARYAEKRAAEVASCFADVIAESLAANDRMQMQLIAAAFQRHDVSAVVIADAAGRQVYSTDRLSSDQPPSHAILGRLASSSPRATWQSQEPFILASHGVRFGGGPIGTVRLLLDRSDLEASIRSANIPVFAMVSLGFVVLTALGIVWLHGLFRALGKVTCAARKIGEGDLSARVPVDGTDEVAELCAVFNSMVERLSSARQEALSKQLEAIHAMINSVEAKDQYTAGHCVRVSGYAKEMLKRRGVQEPFEDFLLQSAALLHDLGKIGIPDGILLKAENLTAEEARIIQGHVTVGAEILSHMDSLKGVALWIRHHHERWDGRGYPDGLSGEAIPFPSRVIAVADAIDAMLTDRPYRKALTTEAALEVLDKGRGTQFDPDVVDLAVAFLKERQRENHDATDAAGDRRLERGLQSA